jgi:hypothetical protein
MRVPEEWPSCGSNPADKIRLTGPAANFLTDLFLIRGLVLRRKSYLAHSRPWNDAPVRSHESRGGRKNVVLYGSGHRCAPVRIMIFML